MRRKLRKTDYPLPWDALRQAVLVRAEHCCECRGACGSDHSRWGIPGHRCAVPHGALIVRDPVTPAVWWPAEDAPRGQLQTAERKQIAIVLSIMPLCQDPHCGDLEHLRAMCQRCHLVYAQHRRHAATRLTSEAAGQLSLLRASEEARW